MGKKFFTDESLATFVDETKSYVNEKVSKKADENHLHDDIYYTKEQVDMFTDQVAYIDIEDNENVEDTSSTSSFTFEVVEIETNDDNGTGTITYNGKTSSLNNAYGGNGNLSETDFADLVEYALRTRYFIVDVKSMSEIEGCTYEETRFGFSRLNNNDNYIMIGSCAIGNPYYEQ